MAAGAKPSWYDINNTTPLFGASKDDNPEIVDYLLRQPAVKATIDTINFEERTALSQASEEGPSSNVQLLLNAGADATIPAGNVSSLFLATSRGHTANTALLHEAIAGAGLARFLLKACAIVDTTLPSSIQRGRLKRGKTMPRVDMAPTPPQQQQHEQ